MAKSFFICYSRADAEIVEGIELELVKLAPALKESLWRDVRNIPSDKPWEIEIEKAIDACDGFIFMFSASSRDRDICRSEIKRAFDNQKIMYALRISPADFKTLPLTINRLTLIDLFDDRARQLPAVANQLLLQMGKPAVAVVSSTASTRALPGRRGKSRPPIIPPSHFVGRDKEMGQLLRYLQNDANVLITLTGRGGSGKTTLACKVISQLYKPREAGTAAVLDAVIYLGSPGEQISFAALFNALRDLLPDPAVGELAAIFAETGLSVTQKMNALLDELGDQKIAVLLNQFDQVLNAQLCIVDKELREALAAIIGASAHCVTLVITTRERPAELNQIPLGRRTEIPVPRGISQSEMATMLGLMPMPEEVDLTSLQPLMSEKLHSCTAGNPKALELLLGMLPDSGHTLGELLRQLPQDVSDCLFGETYKSLDDAGRGVLSALALLWFHKVPEPTVVAIAAVVAPQFLPGIQETLRRLITRQLIRRVESGTYTMDPLDAEQAVNHIPVTPAGDGGDASQTLGALRGRAIDFVVNKLIPADKIKTDADLDGYESAIDLCIADARYDQASSILLQVDFEPMMRWGYSQKVLDFRLRLDGLLTSPNQARYNAAIIGSCYSRLGYYTKAMGYHQKAMDLARQANQPARQRTEVGNLALCFGEVGEIDRAATLHAESMALCRQLEGRGSEDEGFDLSNLGWCATAKGDWDKAIEYLQQSVQLAEHAVSAPDLANRRANLAMALLDVGRVEEAVTTANAAARAAEVCDEPYYRAEAYRALALSLLVKGDLVGSGRAIAKARSNDVCATNHHVSLLAGVIALMAGNSQGASEAFKAASEQAKELARRTDSLFSAWDTLGLALCGLAVCCSPESVSQAIPAFHKARSICALPGVVRWTQRLLEMIRSKDVQGVLPVTPIGNSERH